MLHTTKVNGCQSNILCISPQHLQLGSYKQMQMTGNLIKDIGRQYIGTIKANIQVNIEHESHFG